MNKVKCVNGHFFDADRFQSCPICGNATVVEVKKEIVSQKAVDEICKTEPLLSSTEAGIALASKKIDELAPTELIRREDELRLEMRIEEEHTPKNQSINDSIQKDDTVPIAHDHDSSPSPLKAAVEKTGAQRISALPKTVSYYDIDEYEPPVGWLVCIKGPYRGKAFNCHVGRNRIGRNRDMEICLAEDMAVTREPQAILIYEPKQRRFYLQAGTGDGLAYLNSTLLFEHEDLHAYDHLALGNSEFVFLPLCGDHFSWDDYIVKE